MQSIAEIKEFFQVEEENKLLELIQLYESDERAGVQKLVLRARKTVDELKKEKLRIAKMKAFDQSFGSYEYIAGVDEVGRGPLAGPVVTCCIILPKDCDLLYINDSKKVSKKKREQLAEQIKQRAIAYKIGINDHKVIDEVNILQATRLAMQDAVEHLDPQPELLLADAITVPGITIPQKSITKGDAQSYSIAAASIVAKVTRDNMMEEFDKLYPEYDFANNMGYGTEKHYAALRKYGTCPIHRMTFLKSLHES